MVGKDVILVEEVNGESVEPISPLLIKSGMQEVEVAAFIEMENVWKSLGGFFTSFSAISSEYIDNSISNMLGNETDSRNVFVKIVHLPNDRLKVSHEDEGTGIDDLNGVFGLGNQDGNRQGKKTTWNVHGFGVKNALSAGNPENDNWRFLTRTAEDIEKKQYKMMKAPYKIGMAPMYIVDETVHPWPGCSNGPGTYVEFECNYQLFSSARLGVKGNYKFEKIIEMFIEDLGFIYANNLKDGDVSINVTAVNENGKTKKHRVSAILPEWEKVRKLKTSKHTLELPHIKKFVDVEYKVGYIEESEDNYKYYKRNRDSLGVEIRINGRLLKHNIFKGIWNLQNHGQYNPFLFQVNLISDDIECLPFTKATKDDFRLGDPVLEELYKWILSVEPQPEKSLKDGNEAIYMDYLADLKEKQLVANGEDPVIIREKAVYTSLLSKLKSDLYICSNQGVSIYEGKLSKVMPLDIAQLRLYWDGLVYEGINPKVARLISKTVSPCVLDIIKDLNTLKDAAGNHYNFEYVTWESEGVIIS